MVHELIEGVPTEQAMFLLFLFAQKGEEDLHLLRYLPDEQSQILSPIGQQLASEPRKQILPLIGKELRELVKISRRSPFDQFDPEWMAEFLHDESPRVISALLQQYPRSIAERVIMALPGHLRQNIPRQQQPLHPEIAGYIKQKFDARCPNVPQGQIQQVDSLSIATLPALASDELQKLMRELGLRELALAFRLAGRGALTELCRGLERNDSERLLTVIRQLTSEQGGPEAKEQMKSATRIIQAVTRASRSNNKKKLIEDTGLAKLKEAAQELSPEEQQAIVFNLPRKIGVLFQSNPPLDLRPDEKYRIQCEAIQAIQLLSQEGSISPQWGQLEPQYPPPPPEPPEPPGPSEPS